MHDALSTSDPLGQLAFEHNEPEQLQRYRFALRTADFLLCRRCGVYIGAIIEADGQFFGIINTRALTEMPSNVAAVGAISYEDEDIDGRVSRREQNWTPITPD